MNIGDLEEHQIMQAIRDGVADAVWRIATNATDMPCADFYAAIAKGAEEGVYRSGGADAALVPRGSSEFTRWMRVAPPKEGE